MTSKNDELREKVKFLQKFYTNKDLAKSFGYKNASNIRTGGKYQMAYRKKAKLINKKYSNFVNYHSAKPLHKIGKRKERVKVLKSKDKRTKLIVEKARHVVKKTKKDIKKTKYFDAYDGLLLQREVFQVAAKIDGKNYTGTSGKTVYDAYLDMFYTIKEDKELNSSDLQVYLTDIEISISIIRFE